MSQRFQTAFWSHLSSLSHSKDSVDLSTCFEKHTAGNSGQCGSGRLCPPRIEQNTKKTKFSSGVTCRDSNELKIPWPPCFFLDTSKGCSRSHFENPLTALPWQRWFQRSRFCKRLSGRTRRTCRWRWILAPGGSYIYLYYHNINRYIYAQYRCRSYKYINK